MGQAQLHRRLRAFAVVSALGLAGCAPSSTQTSAASFIGEHGAGAARVAAATRSVEQDVSRLSSPPSGAQLQRLARAAAEAHHAAVLAGEWSVSEGGEEGAEEEDLPRAENQATKGADELADAAAALQTYARAPAAGRLAGYRSELARAREQWNEGISQLWYLAHRASPPVV